MVSSILRLPLVGYLRAIPEVERSHRTPELDLMRYGIDQARRAGLEPRHVLNTLPYEELRKAIARREK